MKTQLISVHLPTIELRRIERAAKKLGVTRSDVIRLMLLGKRVQIHINPRKGSK